MHKRSTGTLSFCKHGFRVQIFLITLHTFSAEARKNQLASVKSLGKEGQYLPENSLTTCFAVSRLQTTLSDRLLSLIGVVWCNGGCNIIFILHFHTY